MHVPVLLHEVINGLNLKEGDIVIDGTLGDGGHAEAICCAIGKSGILIGLDEDEQALHTVERRLAPCPCSSRAISGNFRNLDIILGGLKILRVKAILFDLGLRRGQLEESGRGFSFRRNEPLLMTFSSASAETHLTAYEIVNRWKENDLATILKEYGEERFAREIARGIVEARKIAKINTTEDLVHIIQKNTPAFYKRGKKHIARKTFQALRIATNDELEALKEGIAKACEVLTPGGRFAIITFHSIEDRIVKCLFREQAGRFILITKRPILPTGEEMARNPLSRSAKLRIIEKI